MVHKFNGTDAGLDYLKVSWNCPCNFSLSFGNRLVSALPIPIGEEWSNSSTDFNLNTKHVISAPLEASCQTLQAMHIAQCTLTLQTPSEKMYWRIMCSRNMVLNKKSKQSGISY
jgi:hypothetical protein